MKQQSGLNPRKIDKSFVKPPIPPWLWGEDTGQGGQLQFSPHNWSTRRRNSPNTSPCGWKQTSVTAFQSNVSFISLLKPTQFFLTIFADGTTLLRFIDWVDTLGDCAVCYNTVNFIAGLAATPFAWRGLGTNLKLARGLPQQLTSLQHSHLATR